LRLRRVLLLRRRCCLLSCRETALPAKFFCVAAPRAAV